MRAVIFICLLAIIFIPNAFAQVTQPFILRIGIADVYNKKIDAFGPHFRISAPIVRDVELSTQLSYFKPADPVLGYHEFYADLNANLFFIKYLLGNNPIEIDMYLTGGYSFERWLNSWGYDDQGNYRYIGPANFSGFNIGLGWRHDTKYHLSIFNDVRYYTNFGEIAVLLGLELYLTKKHSMRKTNIRQMTGPKNNNILDCPKF